MEKNKQSRSVGIIISYAVTVLGSIINFLLVPVYLKYCGFENYGFFQYIYSIASFATILDFGIGNVVCKYITEYKESGNDDERENVIFYGFLFALLLSVVVAFLSLFIVKNILFVFGEMDVVNIRLAKQLVLLFSLFFVVALFQHLLDGILLAYEKYITIKLLVLIRLLIKVIIVFMLFSRGYGVITIALSDSLSSLVLLLVTVFYIFVNLGVRARFHSINRPLLLNITKLSAAFCLQSVVAYANNSIDKYLVGRIASATSVTIYTLGMQFYSFFGEIPDIIQRYYIPDATKLVLRTSDGKEYGAFAVKPGRAQFLVLGAIFGAFLLFGRHLIILWSGEESLQAWGIGLVLMAAVIVPFVEGICLTILIALNKRMFRSLILLGVAIVNFICSIPLIHLFDAFGAALGTFLSLIIGNCIIMNVYYYKVIRIDVVSMLKEIFKGLLPAAAITILICSPLILLRKPGIMWLSLQCAVYIVVYCIVMWFFGLNCEEKETIGKIVRKFSKSKE